MLTAHAHARVGLLGNPSDLYGGRGLGFAVAQLRAVVTLRSAHGVTIDEPLLRAAWQELGIDGGSRGFTASVESSIPFQAGLSGSSAIITAALRAWNAWFGLGLSRMRIAELAWRTEQERLGVRAGPLDRLVQAHEGLVRMEFAEPFLERSLRRLDPALLPPMLLAWHAHAGVASGDVHAPIFARFQAGDASVCGVMDALARNAEVGCAALEAGDLDAFMACANRNFDLRAEVFPIQAADRALIELGRSLGSATKFPGSGGAVLAVCRDVDHRARVEAAMRARGAITLAPTVALPRPTLRAVFLAAGFATRLYPLTLTKAKPLLEVGGVPMMTRILRQVEAVRWEPDGGEHAAARGGAHAAAAHGGAHDGDGGEHAPAAHRGGPVVDGVVVTNGRFHRDFLNWRAATHARMPLMIVNDGAMTNDERRGAVRDLALALESAPARQDLDGYLVLACDNCFEFDLGRLVARFAASGCAQVIVRQVPAPVPAGRYSEVTLAPDGRRVASFREKPADPRSDLSAIAAYLFPGDLPVRVRAYLQAGGNPDAPGHFLAWLASCTTMEATPLDGAWIDIGSPEDLAKAEALMPERDGAQGGG